MFFMLLPIELITDILLKLENLQDIKNLCLTHHIFQQICFSSVEIKTRIRESKLNNITKFRFLLEYPRLFNAIDDCLNNIIDDKSNIDQIKNKLNFVQASDLECAYLVNVDLPYLYQKWQTLNVESPFFHQALKIFEDALKNNDIITQVSILILLERTIYEFGVCFQNRSIVRRILKTH